MRSISVIGGKAATLLQRTLRDRPERARFVRNAVIGLDAAHEESPVSDEARRESVKVVEVLEALPLLQNLHLRPLHSSVRSRLLVAIRSKPLLAIVCLPRLESPNDALFHATDLQELVTPTLERLEVDFWVEPTPILPFLNPPFPTLALTDIRVFFSGANALVLALLAASGPTLQTAEVYFEDIFDNIELTSASLMPSTKTLRRLQYLTNPSLAALEERYDPTALQVFDHVLPHFEKLEYLSTSATEVSTNIFRLLPPSLRSLRIQSYSHTPSFHPDEALLDAIEDQSIEFHIEHVEINDHAWDEDDIEDIGEALAARGVAFLYTPD
ncbi:hypothetical protein RQP46_004672 [Phenoliferia psychrophenolica]